jgi:CRISPR-associated protein Csm3
MSRALVANIFLKGKIECLTGLHIGGSKEKFEIGGVDNPVHRDPMSRLPYIPGSSLKGKLRMLLEYHLDAVEGAGPSKSPKITNLFGTAAGNCSAPEATEEPSSRDNQNNNSNPLRLIVRDAYPDEPTTTKWESMESELLYTEFKPENTIGRLTSAANPRTMERVVKGSYFDVEFILGIYQKDHEDGIWQDNLDNLLTAMRLLEHSTLGGSGSRGYGQIRFKLMQPIVVIRTDYRTGNGGYSEASQPVPDNPEELKTIGDTTISKETLSVKVETAIQSLHQ